MADTVQNVLSDDIDVYVQKEPKGTGSALLDARAVLKTESPAALIVSFGDMPWINANSVAKLAEEIKQGAAAAVLAYKFQVPPAFGRIIRDGEGNFNDIRQEKDCSPEELKIREIDGGVFAFNTHIVDKALDQLRNDNAAGEYYLTDLPHIIAMAGHKVSVVDAETLEETLGVNDRKHLEFAERIPMLRESEKIIHLANRMAV